MSRSSPASEESLYAILLRSLKPCGGLIVLITVLAEGQALLNLYVPALMAQIINNGVVKGDINYILLHNICSDFPSAAMPPDD